MLSLQRLMKWSFVAGLLLLSSPTYALEDAAVDAEAVQEMDEPSAPQQRRQLWDFFTLLALISPGGCPPGPLGKACHDSATSDGYDGSSGGSGGSGGYYSDENGSDAAEYDQDVDAATYSYQDTVSGTEYQDKTTAGGGGFTSGGGAFRVWMVFLVGSILSATVAVHLGQRKNPLVTGPTTANGNTGTGMKGAVARRIGSVSAFASGAFAGSKAGKEVEMSEGSKPLQMDMGPEADSDGNYENVV